MANSRGYYFGCHQSAGPQLFDMHLKPVEIENTHLPWTLEQINGNLCRHLDGCMQIGERRYCSCPKSPEGEVKLTCFKGWTAMAFWDRSLDRRGNACSVFFFYGRLSFEEIALLAQKTFPSIMSRFPFALVEKGV